MFHRRSRDVDVFRLRDIAEGVLEAERRRGRWTIAKRENGTGTSSMCTTSGALDQLMFGAVSARRSARLSQSADAAPTGPSPV